MHQDRRQQRKKSVALYSQENSSIWCTCAPKKDGRNGCMAATNALSFIAVCRRIGGGSWHAHVHTKEEFRHLAVTRGEA